VQRGSAANYPAADRIAKRLPPAPVEEPREAAGIKARLFEGIAAKRKLPARKTGRKA
jgi:hypothetical protein